MTRRGWVVCALVSMVLGAGLSWAPAVAAATPPQTTLDLLAGAAPPAVTAAPPACEPVPAPALDPRTPEPAAIVICQKSYCADVGLRCIGSGTGPRGCCRYRDCIADSTCTGIDPLPPNACAH